jgi:hypothetical protein
MLIQTRKIMSFFSLERIKLSNTCESKSYVHVTVC